jgi:ADP-heptose:LPS heptosyltransferase
MANQKLVLGRDGVLGTGKLKSPLPSHAARRTPAVRLSRLNQLLLTKKPKICIIRGEGIGDVLMTTPTVFALKQMFHEVEITYATNTNYLDGALYKTLLYNPYIDHITDRNLIVEEDYDLIINLHCPAAPLERKGATPPSRIEIFAAHAGVKLQDTKPHFYLQKDEIESGLDFIMTCLPAGNRIFVQPYATSSKRTFDVLKLKNALEELALYDVSSVILTNKSDGKEEAFWYSIPNVTVLSNPDIRTVASIAIHCDMVLCPDSSLLHLAGALDISALCLFTSTWPHSILKHYPYATYLWGGELAGCEPCWYEPCHKNYICTEYVSSKMIISKCLEHLAVRRKLTVSERLSLVRTRTIQTELV